MMLSTVNLNSSISKENSGQINGLSKKNSLSINNSHTPLQPGSLSHLKHKLYGSSNNNTTERKALGEITNTTSKSNNINGGTNKKSSPSFSSSDNKLLFVPTSNTPQIRKKINTTTLPIISNNLSSVAKVKKPTIVNNVNSSPLHDNNTIHSAPPAPLRLSSKLSNHSIESLIMTPSFDLPISGYTESFEEDIYKFEQNNNYESNDDHSLMIEDNFSFSDYYQDITL
ncbi:hypothetical protein RB653_004365 [Dictyostelium firmibasis]|uniref:Uncharacterized protein n=1 Tax=Dictyostelium firmibasis TaxID=79012 RepID=A0AAN7TZI9_9MYCE